MLGRQTQPSPWQRLQFALLQNLESPGDQPLVVAVGDYLDCFNWGRKTCPLWVHLSLAAILVD